MRRTAQCNLTCSAILKPTLLCYYYHTTRSVTNETRRNTHALWTLIEQSLLVRRGLGMHWRRQRQLTRCWPYTWPPWQNAKIDPGLCHRLPKIRAPSTRPPKLFQQHVRKSSCAHYVLLIQACAGTSLVYFLLLHVFSSCSLYNSLDTSLQYPVDFLNQTEIVCRNHLGCQTSRPD